MLFKYRIVIRILIVVVLVFLILTSACTEETLVTVQPPSLDNVTQALGYSLVPTIMPRDFEFDNYDVFDIGSEIITTIAYKRIHNSDYQQIFLLYPVNLPSSTNDILSLENLVLKWQAPDDATIKVKVNEKEAYIVYGGWSDKSLRELENSNPEFLTTYIPEWNYYVYHNLYFDYELPSGQTVSLTLRALTNPFAWITDEELIAIAESIVFTPAT
ncbi:MAG: hypothetical protein JSV74_00100 [Dehalococcoidia bacterium]|nr:MAG: hypothetical protein JSV74_00100 [Dehalococcoidia bacterium]